VPFVDEAYRLGEGAFATEAINELVDSLTKPRFLRKIIVILAGYDQNMNELLSVNQGLSSRFSEEVVFSDMDQEVCWDFLQQYLKKTGICMQQTDTQVSASDIIHLFCELSDLPSSGNGRDVQTISKSIMGSTFRNADLSMTELTVSYREVRDFLTTFLAGRQARSVVGNPKTRRVKQNDQAAQDLIKGANSMNTTQSTAPPEVQAEILRETADLPMREPSPNQRDAGVTDEIWSWLQSDKASQGLAQVATKNAVPTAEEEACLVAAETAALAKEVERLADWKMREMKCRHEAAWLKEMASRRAQEEAEEKLRQVRGDAKRKRKEEVQVQKRLRQMGVCVAGYRWIKQADGYRCAGGSHYVSNV